MHPVYTVLLVPGICLAQVPVPVISLDKTHHDFGKVLQGNKVSHKYKVTNIGTTPLQIKEVQVSCGCSSSVIGQRHINPGENTFIEVNFDSTGMIGTIHKSLNVISDDPSNSNVLLTFEASVMREIMPSTSMVVFDRISRNSTSSSSIRLESGNDQPVIITDVEIASAPFLSYDVQKEGNNAVLNLNINGRLIPEQRNHGTEILTVHTANNKNPRFLFRIQWDVALAIIASPNRIVWAGVQGQEMRTTINLNHSSARPFKILEAKTTSPLIKVVGISKGRAMEQKLDVTLSAKTKAGMYNEKLILKLDDPDQKQLEINIAAMLR